MSVAEFFYGRKMKFQKIQENSEMTLEAAAETWVKLVLSHIELNKQREMGDIKDKKDKGEEDKFVNSS